MAGFMLTAEALARLMPMHLALDGRGRVVSVGPTLARLLGPEVMGADFTSLFTRRGAGPAPRLTDLTRAVRLHLVLRARPEMAFRGQAVAMGRGVLVNLSFGIGVVQAVRDHGLTEADFAPTDLTVELLYLYEAKTAVLDELRALNQRLQGDKRAAEERALTDALTGLGNRRVLDLALETVEGTGFALAALDLDGFKAVNDALGHAAGDHVLAIVARRLEEECRRDDVIVRLGGDEFVILMPGMDRPGAALDRMGRIIARLAEPIPWAGDICRIGVSVGIVLAGDVPDPRADRLIAHADAALYAAKRAGKGQAVVWHAGLQAG